MTSGQSNPAFQGDAATKTSRPSKDVAPPHYDDDDEVDLRFNLGVCKSETLGKLFCKLPVFIVCCGLGGLVSRMLPSLLGGLMDNLTAQFKLTPDEFSDLGMTQNIGMTLALFVLGWVGKNGHIPFFTGAVCVFQGIVMSIPAIIQKARPYHFSTASNPLQFLAQNEKRFCAAEFPYIFNGTRDMLQAQGLLPPGDVTTMEPEIAERDEVTYNAFLAVVFLTGATSSVFLALPPIFIDNNTLNKKYTGILMGIVTVILEMAIPSGLLINTSITKVPIDLGDGNGISYKDPAFVGAWWIPMLACGILSLVIAIPLLGMPRNFVSEKKQKEMLEAAMVTFSGGSAPDEEIAESTEYSGEKHVSEQLKGHLEHRASLTGDVMYMAAKKKEDSADFLSQLKELPRTVLRLFKNPVFVLLMVFILFITVSLRGAETFRFFYPVLEYNMEKNDVMYALTGGLSIAMIMGTVVSGIISTRIKTRTSYALVMVLAFLFCALLTPIILAFPCENKIIYGLDDQEFGAPSNVSAYCGCQNDPPEMTFGLVCGSDGNTYYSPCYAQCKPTADPLVFGNCLNLQPGNHSNTATFGPCDPGCSKGFWAFIIISCVGFFAFQCIIIPCEILMIRSLDLQDRSLGVSSIFFTMQLMAIPAPKIFGKMYQEMGCLVNFQSGMCVLYDRENLRYVLTGTDCLVYTVSTLILFALYLVARHGEKSAKKKSTKAHVQSPSNMTKM